MTDPETEPAEDFDAAPVEVAADDAPDAPEEVAAGIPDEPEVFVEEIEAAAVVGEQSDEYSQVAPDLPETGDPRVDEVVAKLAGIPGRPTTEHVGVYDEVHRGLQDALANLDQG